MPQNFSTDDLKYMLGRCADNMGLLSDWEQARVEEWADMLDRGFALSPKQAEIVDRMYQKVP